MYVMTSPVTGEVITYIGNLFNLHNFSYNLRNPEFSTPRFNTVKFGKHSLRYLGPVLWNKLSKEVRMSKSIIEFKNRIRTQDLNDTGCIECFLCRANFN